MESLMAKIAAAARTARSAGKEKSWGSGETGRVACPRATATVPRMALRTRRRPARGRIPDYQKMPAVRDCPPVGAVWALVVPAWLVPPRGPATTPPMPAAAMTTAAMPRRMRRDFLLFFDGVDEVMGVLNQRLVENASPIGANGSSGLLWGPRRCAVRGICGVPCLNVEHCAPGRTDE